MRAWLGEHARRSDCLLRAGTKGQYTQEFVLGAEYEILPDVTVGANYIHRSLPSIIEDMSTDGGTTLFIGNPSANYDDEAAELDAQAAMTTIRNSRRCIDHAPHSSGPSSSTIHRAATTMPSR